MKRKVQVAPRGRPKTEFSRSQAVISWVFLGYFVYTKDTNGIKGLLTSYVRIIIYKPANLLFIELVPVAKYEKP